MTVKRQKTENYTIYCLKGDLDLYASGEVRNLIFKEIDKGECNIAMDMENVPYMDSSGVGVMISLIQRIKRVRGKLVFYNMQRSPMKVLEMANITALFKPYPTRKEALNALAQ